MPAAAATQGPTSWGKANVSLEQYRADSVACASAGYYLDVADTNAARILVDASRKLDNMTETGVPDSGNQQSDIYPNAGQGTDSSFNAALNPRIERSLEMAQRMSRTVAAARPEKQMAEVAALQQAAIARCLSARGYHEFRLTGDQLRRLDHLRRGSEARRAYLFSLASDPAVLAAQAV